MRNERINEAVMEHGYTLTALQKYLGLHPSTLSHIVKRIEEEKDARNKICPFPFEPRMLADLVIPSDIPRLINRLDELRGVRMYAAGRSVFLNKEAACT